MTDPIVTAVETAAVTKAVAVETSLLAKAGAAIAANPVKSTLIAIGGALVIAVALIHFFL